MTTPNNATNVSVFGTAVNHAFNPAPPQYYLYNGYPMLNGAYVLPRGISAPSNWYDTTSPLRKIAPKPTDGMDPRLSNLPTIEENNVFGWRTIPLPVPILPPRNLLAPVTRASTTLHEISAVPPLSEGSGKEEPKSNELGDLHDKCIWHCFEGEGVTCIVCGKKHSCVWNSANQALMTEIANACDEHLACNPSGSNKDMTCEDFLEVLSESLEGEWDEVLMSDDTF